MTWRASDSRPHLVPSEGKCRVLVRQSGWHVSEENLKAIRKLEGQYLVATPRSQMKQFEAELLKEDWTQVRPEVEMKKVAIPQGEETYILCRTAGRKAQTLLNITHRLSLTRCPRKCR